jgi:hypothetical protein|tara:strand:+ start:150 stop:332 length:183 start_codon:yes stop_codon:yes gene_type:complete
MIELGYEYPAGAANDPNAPYNEQVCDGCGSTCDPADLDEERICNECINNADTDNYCERET